MNDPVVSVRAAEAGDAEPLATMLADEGYIAGSSDLAARIERYASIGASVLVAEAAGEVVGFVSVLILPRFEVDELFARITALVVDAGVRERGVGRMLMEAAEAAAAAAGVSFLEVTAGHHRPDAQRLFESMGYDAGVAAYLRKRV